jgi:hypothetical protein
MENQNQVIALDESDGEYGDQQEQPMLAEQQQP